MRRISVLLAAVAWLAFVGLAGYELVQKSAGTALGPLPGYELASWADREVRYRATTGILPIDRLLHESQEACLYYHDLALGGVHQ
ncbi:MAG: hypothetical protein R3D98_07530 [Candidatus Krumholzibacteriia bacterium]